MVLGSDTTNHTPNNSYYNEKSASNYNYNYNHNHNNYKSHNNYKTHNNYNNSKTERRKTLWLRQCRFQIVIDLSMRYEIGYKFK